MQGATVTGQTEDAEKAIAISAIHNALQIRIIVDALKFYASNIRIVQVQNEAQALKDLYAEAHARTKNAASRVLAQMANESTDAPLDR